MIVKPPQQVKVWVKQPSPAGQSPALQVSSGMAGALIIAVPVAIVYNIFLDSFVKGITGGALK